MFGMWKNGCGEAKKHSSHSQHLVDPLDEVKCGALAPGPKPGSRFSKCAHLLENRKYEPEFN